MLLYSYDQKKTIQQLILVYLLYDCFHIFFSRKTFSAKQSSSENED